MAAVAVAGTAALAAAMLGGGDDSDNRAAVPEVTTSASLNLGVSEAPSPSSTTPEPTSSSPTPRVTSSSPTPSSTPSATGTTASASASASTTGAVTPSGDPSSTTNAPTTAPPATKTPPAGSPEEGGEEGITLSLGSTGQEVRELQRRLTAVWVYDGRINGRYDEEVRDAVARYQSWRYIPDDPEGVYGPDTRRILEENTPDI
ncbi:peptidoglycan-binding domain-containing protein [Streptomyces zaomyceticus]|uniref:peptidoglycan-binding domain-containing protein n=1 Tax=Streptomyces zaomyceticus TaxID=68286 RepID=UPI0034239EDD